MNSLVIVEREVRSQVAHGIWNALVIFDIDVLIFHTTPQTLDENVVQCSPSAIPADANISGFEPVRKLGTGKLHTLVRVENLWRGYAQGPIQRFQAKPGIQRDRDFPRQDIATEPIDDRHQIDESALEANVRDVTTPDLIAALDTHSS